jgi:hypothetical protein
MSLGNLERWRHEPAPNLWPEIQRRLELSAEVREQAPIAGRRRTRAAARLGLAAAIVAAVAWGLLQVAGRFRGVSEPSVTIEPGGITRIDVGGPPQSVAAGAGAAWVGVGVELGSTQLWRVDAETGEATRVPDLRGVQWPAAGPEGVWTGVCPDDTSGACTGGKIVRIDPATLLPLAEIPVPQPLQMETGHGYVWANIADPQAPLLKIDPATNRVVDRLPCCHGLLSVGEGAVWMVEGSALVKIDPASGQEIARTELRDPCVLEAGMGAVWVATCESVTENLLYRIDPETLQTVAMIRLPGLYKMSAGAGWLWLAGPRVDAPTANGYGIKISRIDPRTNGLEEELVSIEPIQGRRQHFIRTGPSPPSAFIDIGDGAVWVSDFGDGQMIRIELVEAD